MQPRCLFTVNIFYKHSCRLPNSMPSTIQPHQRRCRHGSSIAVGSLIGVSQRGPNCTSDVSVVGLRLILVPSPLGNHSDAPGATPGTSFRMTQAAGSVVPRPQECNRSPNERWWFGSMLQRRRDTCHAGCRQGRARFRRWLGRRVRIRAFVPPGSGCRSLGIAAWGEHGEGSASDTCSVQWPARWQGRRRAWLGWGELEEGRIFVFVVGRSQNASLSRGTMGFLRNSSSDH